MCTALEPLAPHAITTRDWALGSHTDGDDADAWAEVANAMDVPAGSLQRVRQVHGSDVLVRRPGDDRSAELPTADVIVSADPSIAIAIQTADCVPLLIADRRTGVVAAVHAGWRGLAAGVPLAAVRTLANQFGSRANDLIAAAGPSIRACCYEVGVDVRERFEQAGWPEQLVKGWFFTGATPTARNPSMWGLPQQPRPDHWYFDAAVAARDQLESAGVPPGQIFLAELCTASHPGVFCSYRRDGRGAGRIAGTIRANSRLQFAERGE